HKPFRFASVLLRVVVDGKDVYKSVSSLGRTEIHYVPGTPGGRLIVSPTVPGYDDAITSMTFGDQPRLHDVEVVIRRGGGRGTIRLTAHADAGKPPSPVFVSVRNAAGSFSTLYSSKRVELDAEGHADLPDIAPGRAEVSVAGAPGWSVTE